MGLDGAVLTLIALLSVWTCDRYFLYCCPAVFLATLSLNNFYIYSNNYNNDNNDNNSNKNIATAIKSWAAHRGEPEVEGESTL